MSFTIEHLLMWHVLNGCKMHHGRKFPLIIFPGLAGAAAWWYLTRGPAQAEQGPLTASGTIEATRC